MTGPAKSFDQQIAALADAGIAPREGTERKQLLYNWPEDAWTANPFHRLFDLIEHSDDIASIAIKCIEYEDDWNAYARIANVLVKLAKGRLPLENVESRVDFAAETAFLAFSLDGQSHRIEFEWQDAYVDMCVFAELSALLNERATGFAFYNLSPDPMEEGIIVVCLDQQQLTSLRLAGAEVVPFG